MKRFVAILLTGCLMLQSLPGSVLAAQESEIPTEAETVLTVDDSADVEEGVPETTGPAVVTPETEETEAAPADVPTVEVPGEETSAQTESEMQMAPVTEEPTEEPVSEELSSEELSSEESGSEEQSSEELIEEFTSEDFSEAGSEEMLPEDELILEEMTEGESESEEETEFDFDAFGVQMISADSWADKSFLEVKVVSTLPFLSERVVSVSVQKDGVDVVVPRTLTVTPNTDAASASTKFDVAEGSYTVRLHTEKFADYVQTIEVEKYSTAKIEVCLSKTENFASTDGNRGWMRLGDVSGDGKIESGEFLPSAAEEPAAEEEQENGQNYDPHDDVRVMLNSIRGNMNYVGHNLNDRIDSVVDIADLQYLVQSLQMVHDPATVEYQSVPQSLTPVGGTTVTGVENILNDDGITTLAAEKDEPISTDNPVAVSFDFGETAVGGTESRPKIEGMTIQAPVKTGDGHVDANSNNIADGEVVVEYDGGTLTIPLGNPSVPAEAAAAGIMAIAGPVDDPNRVRLEPDGSIVLNFGGQIAVKKVTIKITGTKMADQKLMDIAKVEFVNDMASRIPAPQLSIPEISAKPGNKEITVSWTAQQNVTGYELCVSGKTKKSGDAELTQYLRVSGTTHTIASINDDDLRNHEPYTIKVRSVNGEWSSAWSNTVTIEPVPQGKPDPVDNLVTTGGFRSIRAAWKDMDDADGYMLYYKKSGDETFTPVVAGYTYPPADDSERADRLLSTSYTINGLEDGTEYEVFVIGWNVNGWGTKSISSIVETESGEVPQLPKYQLINTSKGVGVLSDHIVAAYCGDHGDQAMIGSALDQAKTDKPTINSIKRDHAQWALGVVDDDYTSYWKKFDWDDGVSYPVNDFSKGITVTFDAEYEMNYLTFTATDIVNNPERASIKYWGSDLTGDGTSLGCRLICEIDATNRPYYVVKFDKKIKAQQILLYIGTGSARIDLKVGEMHFHRYDQLDDDIMNLFADEMHSSLVEGVTQEQIDALRDRLNTVDPETNEYHPLRKSLELELQAAEELLKWGKGEIFPVDNRITKAKDGHINFGGLNEWQPLGRVAAAGDKLLIYVGHNTKNIGERSDLKLYFTQYHAEANSLSNYYSLKVGPNEVTLVGPSRNDFERGGQLYIAYEGNNPTDQYGVRVNGGTKIPVLNVYKKTGDERTAAIETYVKELEEYQGTIEGQHQKLHKESTNTNVNKYDYGDGTNCFLNSTDLMMDYMMYSFPATTVWNSIKNSDNKVETLDKALKAMDDTMTLFYQHKGLNAENSGKGGRNLMPSRHLNIRYMRMFSGAFMYASGNHIGVEYGSTGLCGAASWNSFGWGIAHEIGHDINDPAYAIAEITNNYFAQLLTSDYIGPRWGKDYKKVYEKVTSGATGRAASVGTQLALYWQLHLAFDDFKEDKKIFTDYDEQWKNLFFARVDTYSRNPGLAKKGDLELKLDAGVDQNLMRLACVAAGENILPFFERWGMVPDENTVAYVNELYKDEKPTAKALYYVNETARDYRVDHLNEDTNSCEAKVEVKLDTTLNQVKLNLNVDADSNPDEILGYEIERGVTSKGETTWEVIGFVQAGDDGTENGTKDASAVYYDTIATMDNRVMQYRVRAVDMFLNYSEVTEPVSAKISTEGVLGKDLWSIETTMEAANDDEGKFEYDENDPDGGYGEDSGNLQKKTGIEKAIDDNWNNAFTGKFAAGAHIIIDMQKTTGVTSVRYKGSDATISIAVSTDRNNWTAVKDKYAVTGDSVNTDTGFATIWFDSVHEDQKDKWIGTYDARYVRFTIDASESDTVTINELDICGPSGDNVEFYAAAYEDGKTPVIGVLEEDYAYDSKNRKNPENLIPKDSLIFAGTYKGNPAYNVVMLFTPEGEVIGAHEKDGEQVVDAEQIILAKVPEKGNLGETSDGIWIYYLRPEVWQNSEQIDNLTQVRAELFRVDDAETLAGERIVSDTAIVDVPEGFKTTKIKLAGLASTQQ